MKCAIEQFNNASVVVSNVANDTLLAAAEIKRLLPKIEPPSLRLAIVREANRILNNVTKLNGVKV